MRLIAQRSLLLCVDIQERLLPVIAGAHQVVEEAIWLTGVAQALGVSVWLTEHLPDKLGATSPQLLEALGAHRRWSKHHFSIMAESDFAQALERSGKDQIIICGTEAHVCVLQSALGLLEAGYEVYWLSEATASRRSEEARLARERACAHGAYAVTADMVAYEWLTRADTALFQQVHQRFLKPRAGRALHFY